MARKDIEYVVVPKGLIGALGEPDEESHLYRQIGRRVEHDAWWDAVCEVCGVEGSVSPGGASMFGPMSRAGVYKRLKEGRLTGFLFHWAPKGKRWSIRELFGPQGPGEYMFIPVVELRRWGELLRERREIPVEPKLDDRFLLLKREKLREYLKRRDRDG